MRDHNETYEPPPHGEHPNPDPWGGDGIEEEEGHPCDAPLVARAAAE